MPMTWTVISVGGAPWTVNEMKKLLLFFIFCQIEKQEIASQLKPNLSLANEAEANQRQKKIH